jgi:hypothetical protein
LDDTSSPDIASSHASPAIVTKSHNAREHESNTGIVSIPETKRPCIELLEIKTYISPEIFFLETYGIGSLE